MFCGLVKRHESLKKYIKTIINQLPQYIAKYPPEEQKLLKEFLSVVAFYEEADFNRQELSSKLDNYRHEIKSRNNFMTLPFSWFVETYIRYARAILSISKFHATHFYEFIVKHFRGTDQIQGAFKLIKNKTSLSDLTWEKLQYECSKLLIPLTPEQFKILEATNNHVVKNGIYSLDPRSLKNEIISQIQFLSSTKPKPELKRFFSLIDGQWRLLFFSPAFGLDRVFFHMQLNESSSINDLIGNQNPNNTVLTISDIYKAREIPNTYIGSFYVPSQNVEDLLTYIKRLVHEDLLVLHDLQRIKSKWTSSSITQYKPNIGWINPNLTKMKSLTRLLKSTRPKRIEKRKAGLYIPNKFNLDWYFTQHPLPNQIIKLYCEIAQGYSFSNLPLVSYRNEVNRSLTKDELGLLKQMYYNRVLYVDFIPWRIVNEFSMDLYNITIPKLSSSKLNSLLQLLPYSEIIETQKDIKIWTRIPKILEEWMNIKLEWEVISIIQTHFAGNLNYNWYNKKKLQWNTPKILLTPN